MSWRDWQVPELPEAEHGCARIERFEVSRDAAALDALRSGWRAVPEGTYTRLLIRGGLWMSDTPAELQDMTELWEQAKQQEPGWSALVHGLGLGCAVKLLLTLPVPPASIDVVEIEPDVCELTGWHWIRAAEAVGCRLTLWPHDALKLKWPVGKRWSLVWHDIWRDITDDNRPTRSHLNRRFARRCDWQGGWAQDYERSLARRGGWR